MEMHRRGAAARPPARPPVAESVLPQRMQVTFLEVAKSSARVKWSQTLLLG
jgi:hypothetical protein